MLSKKKFPEVLYRLLTTVFRNICQCEEGLCLFAISDVKARQAYLVLWWETTRTNL